MTKDLRARVLALLERIEWGANTWQGARADEPACPECFAYKDDGAHAPDCALAAMIEELKREG